MVSQIDDNQTVVFVVFLLLLRNKELFFWIISFFMVKDINFELFLMLKVDALLVIVCLVFLRTFISITLCLKGEN